MKCGIYFEWPGQVRSLWTWLLSSWHINSSKGGYLRLGQYREKGIRFFGICFVSFENEAAKNLYEEQNGIQS